MMLNVVSAPSLSAFVGVWSNFLRYQFAIAATASIIIRSIFVT